jgi:uncharacterized protein YcaQ
MVRLPQIGVIGADRWVKILPVPLRVSKAAVRALLLHRQGLTGALRDSGQDLLTTLRQLECVQLDPVAAVERNQHLVFSARLSQYHPQDLEILLEQGQVFEYWANAACVIPMEDYPFFAGTRRRHSVAIQPELDKLGPVVRDVLRRLEREGPLPAKAFVSDSRVQGYWDNDQAKTKATSHVLNLLNDTGRIQVVRRNGTTRFFDLPERVVPKGLLDVSKTITEFEASTALLDKYIRAYCVIDPADARFGWQKLTAAERRRWVDDGVQKGTLAALEIEGVRQSYYVRAEDVDLLRAMEMNSSPKTQGIRFLPPLDNLLWRRQRIQDLFAYSYTWEVYIPAAKRQFGYYAMPILAGDRLIGRIDPRLDRDQSRLNVVRLQLEAGVRWTKTLEKQMHRGLEKFARFHQAEFGSIVRMD